jgi:hypothetical protein
MLPAAPIALQNFLFCHGYHSNLAISKMVGSTAMVVVLLHSVRPHTWMFLIQHVLDMYKLSGISRHGWAEWFTQCPVIRYQCELIARARSIARGVNLYYSPCHRQKVSFSPCAHNKVLLKQMLYSHVTLWINDTARPVFINSAIKTYINFLSGAGNILRFQRVRSSEMW